MSAGGVDPNASSVDVQEILRERYRHILDISDSTKKHYTSIYRRLNEASDSNDPGLLRQVLSSHITQNFNSMVRMKIPGYPLPSLDEIRLSRVGESCATKSAISCFGGEVGVILIFYLGFVLGGVIGLFTAGVDPLYTVTGTEPVTTKAVAKEMWARAASHGKNFAIFGTLFAATECGLESVRGKSDLFNASMSGAIVGAAVGLRGGLHAAAISALGLAAFSTVFGIYFM